MQTCHVMFLRCGDSNDHIINRMVSAFDPPFCHVEWVSELGYGCSVFQDEVVFFKKRRYLNERYESISLLCTSEQLSRMNNYCRLLVSNQVEFDKTSMYSSFLRKMGLSTPWCSQVASIESKKTYCSKLVMEILRYGGFPGVTDDLVHVVTPSSLYTFLKDSSCRVIDPIDSRKALRTRVSVSRGSLVLNRVKSDDEILDFGGDDDSD